MPLVGSRVIKTSLINLASGVVEAIYTNGSYSLAVTPVGRCIYNNGMSVYTEFYNGTTLQLDTLAPAGNTFHRMFTETSGLDFLDVCFDGQFYWLLTATTVYQVSGPHTTDKVLKSWTHGVTTARGIMTDGLNIIIIEA